MRKSLVVGLIAALVLCSGCTTMIARVVERSTLSNMKEKPIHDRLYVSPATRPGTTIYRWYHNAEMDRNFGSWIEVLEVNGDEVHIVSYPEGDLFLHKIHCWVRANRVVRAELHYGDRVFPLKVESAHEGGMYTAFESLPIDPAQDMTVNGKTHHVTRIETLSVSDETSAVGTTYGSQYKCIRYISDEVPLGVVKEETFFSTQVLRDNWEYVKLGLKAMDPMRSTADTLMGLMGTFREKEKTNFQIEFFQEERAKVAM